MDTEVAATLRRLPITTLAGGAVLLGGALAALSGLVQAWMTITGRYLFVSGGADPVSRSWTSHSSSRRKFAKGTPCSWRTCPQR